MTPEEARKVIWTPRKHNKPIGELLDQALISEQDLVWAALMAAHISDRIRQAARTILASKLQLPIASSDTMDAGPRVIMGSDYLARMERWSFGEVFFIFGLASGAGVMYSIQFVQEWLKGTITIPVLIVVLAMLALIARNIHKYSTRAYKEYEQYKKGREGEDKITERAIADLDGGWTILRNVILPDRKRDIDLLLVGPGGIYALEIKTYGAGTKLTASQSKARWWKRSKPASSQAPDASAAGNAAELKQRLQQRNCAVDWVNAILVFAEYQPTDFELSSPNTTVWSYSEIDNRLAHLRSSKRMSPQQVEAVVAEIGAMTDKK